ncbi:MAG: type II toxin-antitoxin system VapC family toxin [Rhizobiaceae bacterium]|nr:type II toxin-antitoxin system VapC family toxin [Rhizobiaceae bacterium]
MLYLDTSYLIPLVRSEALSNRIQLYLESMASSGFVTSSWTMVEYRSALAREVRMGQMPATYFHDCCQQLD